MFCDETLALAAELFPSLEKLNLDGARLTSKGFDLLPKFRKLQYLSLHCKNVRLIASLINVN